MGLEMLPTVQDMLQTCSHDRLADVLVERYVIAGGRRREKMRSLWREVIERMSETPASQPCGIVVVPRVRFSCSASYSITRSVQAICVDARKYGARLGEIGPQAWERVLSFYVWSGEGACLHDRYALIADACWHMACAGRTAQEARRGAKLRVGCSLYPQWMDEVARQWNFGERDFVDEEYRSVLGSLIEGWNADADIAFFAETLAVRRLCDAA